MDPDETEERLPPRFSLDVPRSVADSSSSVWIAGDNVWRGMLAGLRVSDGGGILTAVSGEKEQALLRVSGLEGR